MRLRKALARANCHIRHRWSRWAHVKTECGYGCLEIDPDMQFRMCRRCGHQEIRERVCA